MNKEWLDDYVKNKYVEAIMGIFGVSRMVATMYLEHHDYSLDKTVEDLREQTKDEEYDFYSRSEWKISSSQN